MDDMNSKILLVDDEANVLKALVRQLRGKFDLTTASSGEEALELIRRDGPFAVVVTDYSMPAMNGVEFLRAAKELVPDIVSVMLTGFAQLEVALAAFHECQIFRFLAKPWSQGTLEATLNDCLERYRMIVEQKPLARMSEKAQNEVIRDARTDRLMGIWNRATFDDYLQDLDGRMAQSGTLYAIALADIDNFKKFNDCYGHTKGDEALRSVAQTMRKALRTQDLIARYGGEEIVVVCEATDETVAMAIGEKLRRSVSQLGISHRENADFGRVTISIGIALRDSDREERTVDVLLRADQAMYAAKRCGRNRIELAPQCAAAISPPQPATSS